MAAVHAYQRVGRPLLAGHIACRYAPTCSDYSIGAVRRHGLLTGLRLSARRIRSCTRNVPPGTVDLVP